MAYENLSPNDLAKISKNISLLGIRRKASVIVPPTKVIFDVKIQSSFADITLQLDYENKWGEDLQTLVSIPKSEVLALSKIFASFSFEGKK